MFDNKNMEIITIESDVFDCHDKSKWFSKNHIKQKLKKEFLITKTHTIANPTNTNMREERCTGSDDPDIKHIADSVCSGEHDMALIDCTCYTIIMKKGRYRHFLYPDAFGSLASILWTYIKLICEQTYNLLIYNSRFCKNTTSIWPTN